jgi:acyl carrier protein
MAEWVAWMLGFVCIGLAVLKLAGGLWCLVELHRKWRSIPEFWSIDWLDIVFRVQREFGVVLSAHDFEDWTVEARLSLTAGQLWELVGGKLTRTGSDVPADGWPRVVTVLAEALNVKPARITPESRLYGDLGMTRGIE